MSKILPLIWILSLCVYATQAQPSDARGAAVTNTQQPTVGSTFAIIIGISKYEQLQKLQYANRDAIAFKTFLMSKSGGFVPQDNIKMFVDDEATRTNFFMEYSDLKQRVKPGDVFYVYFAGHGDIEQDISEGDPLLLLTKSYKQNYIAGGEYIPLFDLSRYLGNISKKGVTVIFIADACHSGAMMDKKESQNQTLVALQQSWGNEIKMLSCQPNEVSEENSKWGGGRGIFSYVLEDGLKGMADYNNDSVITVKEIKKYLELEVSKQTGDLQNPDIHGDLTKVIARVDPPTLLALKEHKTKTLNQMTDLTAQRGSDDYILAGITNKKALETYKRFKDAVDKHTLLKPDTASALYYYQKIQEMDSLMELKKMVRRTIVSALQDGAMIFIQDQLNGKKDIENYNEKILNDEITRIQNGIDNLQAAIGILGEEHYLTPSYKARKLYLEAYIVYFRMTTYTREYTTPNLKKCIEKLEEAVTLEENASYAYYLLGGVYAYSGKQAKARENYEAYLKLNPKDGFAFLNLAYISKNLKNEAQADSFVQVALKVGSNDMPKFIEGIGGYYYNYEQWENAKKYFKQTLQLDPKATGSLLNLGVIARREKQYDEAIKYYLGVLAVDSTHAWAANNIANIYSLREDYPKAEAFYVRAIKYDSLYHMAICNLGKQYESLKEYDKAFKLYHQSKSIEPYYEDNYYGIGNVHYKKENYDSAILYFYYCSVLDSTHANNYYSLGNCYKMKKNYEDALFYYKKAYGADSNYASAYNAIGNIYYDDKKYEDAIPYYSYAVLKDTAEAVYWNNLGKAYQYSDSIDVAMRIYKNKAIKLDPKYVAPHLSIGNIYYDQNQYDSAEVWYLRALKLDSTYTTAMYNMALIYEVRKDYEKAISWHKKALKVDSTYVDAATGISKAYQNLENTELAIKYGEIAISMKKEVDVSAYNTLAKLQYTLKNYDRVKELLNKVLETDPVNYDATYRLGMVDMDEKNYEGAVQKYTTLIERDSTDSDIYSYLNRAVSRQYINDNEGSKKDFIRALQLDSTYYFTYQQFGLLYQNGFKEPEKATPYFHKAVELDTANYYYSLQYLAYSYFLQKDVANAEKYFKEALVKTPTDNSAPYNLACLFSLNNRNAEALKYLELSLKNGYADFEHIGTDTDLDNIRNMPEYTAIIKKYKK